MPRPLLKRKGDGFTNEAIKMNLTLYTGRPEDCTGRLEKEVRTYDLLDKLGM